MRFAYGQGPDLSYWWLDGYVDFNDAQTPKVRDALESWFQWHRRTQLDDYAQFLVRLQRHAAGPVTPELVCSLYREAMSRVEPMLDKALPMALDTIRSLTPAQIQHIERKYAKVNREFRNKFLQADANERFEASLTRAVERADMFYGSLDDRQAELLRQGVAASPFNPELWLEERMLRQKEAVATLRRLLNEEATPDQTLAALRVVVSHVQRSPRPHYVDYQHKLLEYNCRLTAQLHNSTSRDQRAAAVRRFKGWEDDARVLASESRKAP